MKSLRYSNIKIDTSVARIKNASYDEQIDVEDVTEDSNLISKLYIDTTINNIASTMTLSGFGGEFKKDSFNLAAATSDLKIVNNNEIYINDNKDPFISTKVEVNDKGIIVSNYGITESDIPNIPWSKIVNNNSTSYTDYNMSWIPNINIDFSIIGELNLVGKATQDNELATTTNSEEILSNYNPEFIGQIIVNPSNTGNKLLANGALLKKSDYQELSDIIPVHIPKSPMGFGRPWQWQIDFNNNTASDSSYYTNTYDNYTNTSLYRHVSDMFCIGDNIYVFGEKDPSSTLTEQFVLVKHKLVDDYISSTNYEEIDLSSIYYHTLNYIDSNKIQILSLKTLLVNGCIYLFSIGYIEVYVNDEWIRRSTLLVHKCEISDSDELGPLNLIAEWSIPPEEYVTRIESIFSTHNYIYVSCKSKCIELKWNHLEGIDSSINYLPLCNGENYDLLPVKNRVLWANRPGISSTGDLYYRTIDEEGRIVTLGDWGVVSSFPIGNGYQIHKLDFITTYNRIFLTGGYYKTSYIAYGHYYFDAIKYNIAEVNGYTYITSNYLTMTGSSTSSAAGYYENAYKLSVITNNKLITIRAATSFGSEYYRFNVRNLNDHSFYYKLDRVIIGVPNTHMLLPDLIDKYPEGMIPYIVYTK